MNEENTGKLNAWPLLKRSFRQCFGMHWAVWMVAYLAVWPVTRLELADLGSLAWLAVYSLALYGLGSFADAFITLALAPFERGEKLDVGATLKRCMKLYGRVLALSAMCAAAMVAGACLLLVPGIIIGCALFAALPACVYENLPPLAAMKRSWRLTNGYRMDIFLAMLRMFIILLFTLVPVYGLLEYLAESVRGLPVLLSALAFILAIPDTLLTVFLCIAAKNIYDHLVVLKLGAGGNAAVEVFS